MLMCVGYLMSKSISRYTAGGRTSEGQGSSGGRRQDALSTGFGSTKAENVTANVRAVLESKEMRPLGAQQEEEWKARIISFIAGEGSCNVLCASAIPEGGVCARDWFVHIDACSAAKAAFPQSRCIEGTEPHAPGYSRVGVTDEVLVSRDSKSKPPSCGAMSPAGGQRLCGCVSGNRARPIGSKGIETVRDLVLKSLEDRDKRERDEAEKGGK